MARGVKTGGRVKGTPNKTTALLKDAIIRAAELTGRDGEGSEELVGYLRRLAVTQPAAFASLLGRVLPLQLSGDPEGAPLITTIVREVVNAPNSHGSNLQAVP